MCSRYIDTSRLIELAKNILTMQRQREKALKYLPFFKTHPSIYKSKADVSLSSEWTIFTRPDF